MRCDWPRAQTDQWPRLWLLSGPPGPPRHCLPSLALGPCQHEPGKTGVGGDGAVIGPRRARVERQRQIATLSVGVPRGGGRGGKGEAVSICQHEKSSPPIFAQYLYCQRRGRGVATKPLLLSHTAILGSRAMGPTPLTGWQVSAASHRRNPVVRLAFGTSFRASIIRR